MCVCVSVCVCVCVCVYVQMRMLSKDAYYGHAVLSKVIRYIQTHMYMYITYRNKLSDGL